MDIETLKAYPEHIEKAERCCNKTRREIADAADQLTLSDAAIERAIADNSSYKNEQQRKAARLEARTLDPEYTRTVGDLETLKARLANQETTLRYWCNAFSAAKLEARWAIAQAESLAAAA